MGRSDLPKIILILGDRISLNRAMTKRTRTILFITCLILFALATPSIILYSQGYRVDFNPLPGGKIIVRTGGLYFKVLPAGADVYLNAKFKNKTAFFGSSLLIKNLLPKTYQIEIKKQGYHTRQKTLEVKEAQVTEAKNIILFPEKPDFTLINQPLPEIEESATSTDRKKVMERPNGYEIWVSFPGEEEKIFLTRFSEKIGHMFWLNDDYLIFNVGDKIKIAEIDSRDTLNVIDLVEFNNPEIFWSQKDRKLYVLSLGNRYLSDNLLP